MRWAGYLMTLLLLAAHWLLEPSAAVFSGLVALTGIPPLSWGLLWLVRKRLRLELSAPAAAQKGETVSVSAALVNKSMLPVGLLELTVSVENSVTGQRLHKKLRCSETEKWEVKSDWCGCLTIRIEKARLYDLLGLLWVNVTLPKKRRVVIMPDTFPVMIRQEQYPAPMDDCQDYAPDRRGQDRTETYQVRGYVPGDSLAQIHWKLSSKLDTLMVREPGCPVDQDMMVFVDRCWGDVTPAEADSIMEAAVSVCQSLSEGAVPFQLVWNEETIHTQEVTERDGLPEAVSALLKSENQTVPGTDVYVSLYGGVKMARVIYIGTGLPQSLDEFAGQTNMVCLLCAGGEDSGNVVCFTPETCEEALAQVSWS